MNRKKFDELISNYQEGRLSGKLLEAMDTWFDSLQDAQQGDWTAADIDQLKQALDKRLQPEAQVKRWRAFATRALPYAAAVLLVASVVGWLVVSNRWPLFGERHLAATEVLPGGNKATLTLADGRTIDLSEAQTGIIVNDEDIMYSDGASLGLPPADTLLLTTPKGGTYQITLPDGSSVWLNSASTLKYPSRFTGDTREVILTGEAYFDVEPVQVAEGARVSSVPFKVQTAGQTVEVLGTQFNISAYADDPETKTTLVSGRVRVAPLEGGRDGLSGGRGVTKDLKPGQQATTREAVTTINEVDVEQYTSWKDGHFSLQGSVPYILEQVSRWYDVDVRIEGTVTDSVGFFTFPRDRPLSHVMTALQSVVPQLNYRIEIIKANNEGTRPERRLTIFR